MDEEGTLEELLERWALGIPVTIVSSMGKYEALCGMISDRVAATHRRSAIVEEDHESLD